VSFFSDGSVDVRVELGAGDCEELAPFSPPLSDVVHEVSRTADTTTTHPANRAARGLE
jgi:hypothetical protein